VTHDVLVMGAGPAGSATARRLAAAGVSVALIGGDSRSGIEGLSTRSHALLVEEGIEAGSGAFGGPYRRDGYWALGRKVEGLEWLTERRALARALRATAVASGACSYLSTVRSVTYDGSIWWLCLGDGTTCSAPFVVDARGRRGAEVRGPVLLAVGQRYRANVVLASGTHLSATEDGWCWWVTHGRDIWVQVVGRPRQRHPNAWIGAAAEQVSGLARALAGAEAVGKVAGRPAHARLGVQETGDPTWRVGDAAMALDPLSGQGIYEALRGARLVSTAIQSVLRGGDPAIARRFVAERTREAWFRGVKSAASFYSELAIRSEFWADTARQYLALIPPPSTLITVVEQRPVLVDGRIVEREVLVGPGHTRGVFHVEGVPLVALKRYLDGVHNATVPSAADALDLPPTAVASAIQWLRTSGLLRQQAPASGALGG